MSNLKIIRLIDEAVRQESSERHTSISSIYTEVIEICESIKQLQTRVARLEEQVSAHRGSGVNV